METPKNVQETGPEKPIFLKTRQFRILVAISAVILLIPIMTTVALNYTHVGDRVSAYVQSSLGKELFIEGKLGASWGVGTGFFSLKISSWQTVNGEKIPGHSLPTRCPYPCLSRHCCRES